MIQGGKYRVMRSFKNYKSLFVFSVVSNLLLLVAPIHMLQVYDRVLSSRSEETLFYISLIAVCCLLLYGLTEMLKSQIASRLAAKYAVTNADMVFDRITNGAIPIEQSKKTMLDFETVRAFLASRTMVSLFDIPFAPVFLILLFLLHFQLGLLTTLGAGLLVAIAWLNKSSTSKLLEEASKSSSQAASFSHMIVNRAEDIRAMGLLPALTAKWGFITAQNLQSSDAAAAHNARFYGASKSCRQIIQVSIMAWGAWLVLSGDMSGGMIFAATMISSRVLQPIEQLIGGWDMINKARSADAAIQKVLETGGFDEEKIRQPAPNGKLVVENVSYHVEQGQNNKLDLLKPTNLTVYPGQVNAIIGPSGSGKSTLVRIIAGAQKASEGKVYLDSCAQDNWPIDQWGQYVGYVGQEVMLFPSSIADNISRMSNQADEKRIINAAKMAGCHDLINALPNGYETIVGDEHIRLSGGQKQRIALARALYTSPKLLVLDEPNSNLDAQGQRSLMQTLKQLKQNGVAIIIVTQRQQILKIADSVFAMHNGKLSQVGDEQLKLMINPNGIKVQPAQNAKTRSQAAHPSSKEMLV